MNHQQRSVRRTGSIQSQWGLKFILLTKPQRKNTLKKLLIEVMCYGYNVRECRKIVEVSDAVHFLRFGIHTEG